MLQRFTAESSRELSALRKLNNNQRQVCGVKQNAKKCAIGETKCYEILSLCLEDRELIRRERRDGGEGEERGLRKGA